MAALVYTTNISLDIDANGPYETIYAKQGDNGRSGQTNGRKIVVSLYKDGEFFDVRNASYIRSAALRVRRPNGTEVISEAVIQPDDGKISIVLNNTVLAVAGKGYGDIVLYSYTGTVLSCIPFMLVIVASPTITNDKVIDSDEYIYFSDFALHFSQSLAESMGLIPKGEWDASTLYEPMNVVSRNGISYIAKQENRGNVPPNETYWQQCTGNISLFLQNKVLHWG